MHRDFDDQGFTLAKYNYLFEKNPAGGKLFPDWFV